MTGYYYEELRNSSKELGIPLVVLMNSWDNPSQKAAGAGSPDKLGVWGEQTRRHAVEYLRMPERDVVVIGAAQFELYRRPVTEPDEEIRAQFNVPMGKDILLYAGVSKSINETRHLRLIDEAIERGELGAVHVLYRPHPWRGGLVDGEEDFFSAGLRHVTMDPAMDSFYRQRIRKPDASLNMADYEVTRKLMHMICGTISCVSTMLIESLLHGKPVVAYMPAQDTSKTTPMGRLDETRPCPGPLGCGRRGEMRR